MAPLKANADSRLHTLRVLLLMREGPFVRRTGAVLEGLRVRRCTQAATLAAVASVLRAQETDVIVAEVHADFSEGLMLPSLLKELSAAGRLERVPRVLWVGEARQANGTSGASLEPAAGMRQGWCENLNGVSLNALASHARLARAAGIPVEIAGAIEGDGLRLALDALPDMAGAVEPVRAPAAPDEEDVIAGASLIQALRSKFPSTRVLVFSAHPDPARVSQALRAGASGFVGKRQPMHELINAIDVVARGSVYVGTGTTSDDGAQRDAQADIGSALSSRERDVIRCYLEGMTVSEIALKFNRSIKTISSQKASAFRKLGVSSNNDLFKLRDHLDAV